MKKKLKLRITNTGQAIIAGTTSGIAGTLLSIALAAVILTKYDLPHEIFKYFYIFFSITGGLSSGFITGKYCRSKGVVWSSLAALTVSIILFMTVLIFNGFSVTIYTVVILPLYLLTGAISGIISSNLR